MRKSKEVRHGRLEKILEENPLQTDGELARKLGVSIQTIRLDRLEIGIPDLRERTRRVAAERLQEARSLSDTEIIGEITELVLGHHGTSRLEITSNLVLRKTSIARGHHLFAQVNSLAVAIVDAPVALTGIARVRYRRPVRLGEVVRAEAFILKVVGARHMIRVVSKVEEEVVLSGRFYVVAREETSRS
ncbi:transcription factor FapR [Heliorestis convoluta]|uniref:Transcription factor FapR n=1 Tax=Heliorestis convoluta TaxID=356322 RepID=A0A5Q2N181_9FIRM|nr:transcription factor FapR [Heliorestis convoluta]QGG48111.1 transcription factor FapR [Heliorestis convoluta]